MYVVCLETVRAYMTSVMHSEMGMRNHLCAGSVIFEINDGIP